MTTKEYTKSVLEENQQFRDNDTELLIRVLRDFGVIDDEMHAERFRLMSKQHDLWDIRRNRQKIQEEGELLPSPEIQALRKKREVKERDKYSKAIAKTKKDDKPKFELPSQVWDPIFQKYIPLAH